MGMQASYDLKSKKCTIVIDAEVQDVGNPKTLRFFTTGGNISTGIMVDAGGNKREVIVGLNGYIKR
jgi:hypothetical protein